MCGIVGYTSLKKLDLDHKKIVKELKHRGPDSQSYLNLNSKKNHLFFGFTRLAIQDQNSRSNQPFLFKNLIICFNGEIYNFNKIKSEMKKENIKFETNSDTEVLIKLIYFKGLKTALNKIEGMWAFSLYNKKTKKLILCRDRFGEKPLLYIKTNKTLYFSSEISVFKKFLNDELKVNLDYLKRYLFLDYRYLNKDNDHFFNKITKVPPGSFIEIDENLNQKNFKYFKFIDKKNNKESLNKIVNKTQKKLKTIVADSMISDRPIGFCLSGGIDSTGLVSIAKKILKKKIKCFTVFTDDKKYDEFKMVDKTVKNLKLKHKWIKVNKNKTLENIKKIIKHRKYPILTVTSYIQWLMFKEISKNNIKVIISGNGSDEVFSGYYDHHLAYLNDIKKNKKLFRKSLFNWSQKINPLIRNKDFKDYENYSKNNNNIRIVKGKNQSKEFGIKKFDFPFFEKKFTKSFLKNRMINEMFSESVPVILQEEDINAMQFSIENRSPYLNSKLYRYIINLEEKNYINDGFAKFILRKSLKKISPNHIIDNYEKIGFNISPEKLLNFQSKKILYIFKQNSEIYKIVDKLKVISILKSKQMIKENSNFLFKLLNAKIFIDANS